MAGKSLGSFAAAPAADRGLPGIWLTPASRDTGPAPDLRRATAPFLLAGDSVGMLFGLADVPTAIDRSYAGEVIKPVPRMPS